MLFRSARDIEEAGAAKQGCAQRLPKIASVSGDREHRRSMPWYVVDHVTPLACGGRDDASNMQWQTTADAKAKDRFERAECSPLGQRRPYRESQPEN